MEVLTPSSNGAGGWFNITISPPRLIKEETSLARITVMQSDPEDESSIPGVIANYEGALKVLTLDS